MSAVLPRFIAIGASGAEGLTDIKVLLAGLRKPVPAILMVVLHRPSDKISHLRDVLARGTDISIVVAAEAGRLDKGVCYIGEPDGHLTLMETQAAHLVPGSGHSFRNRTIDALSNPWLLTQERAIASCCRARLTTGHGGLAAIHAAGGLTMVLEPGKKPRGMQQNAIEYDGPISKIGSAAFIAIALNQAISSAS